MTEFENKLIIDNLDLVDQVIRTRLSWCSGSVLLAYEDLQAVGREALCIAATKYKQQIGDFAPFACRCIYNAIIDHCRIERLAYDHKAADTADDKTHETVMELNSYEITDIDGLLESIALNQLLKELKKKYSGVARLGIEAIELKLLGFSSREIAARYRTSVNNVNAWIARARSKIKSDDSFRGIVL